MPHCPSCDGECVTWNGSYFICNGCKRMGHHNPCIYCGSKDLEFHESSAECLECGWRGDPYDLLDEDD